MFLKKNEDYFYEESAIGCNFMLHWSMDPLLLDEKPINYNEWETANAIIAKQGMKTIINEDLSFKNLYGIMVRKIDFVRKKSSDRIIARFPFLIINETIKQLIHKDILLIAQVVRDYFYQSINKTILQWKKIIVNYLEKGSLPFPLFRCAQEIVSEPTLPYTNTKIQFASARGETFTFPTKLTNKLAYLCGICNGDGNLRDYWIIIADETKEHIEFISNLLTDLFSKTGKIMKTGGAWIVKLNLLWAVRLFNFFTNQAIDEPKYESLGEPTIFKTLGEPFLNLYWRGVFDADGSFKNQIAFCSISESYTDDFQHYLTRNKIRNKLLAKKTGGYQLNISAKDKFRFANIIGSSHPKKQKDFLAFLTRSTSHYQFKGFNYANITSNNYFDFKLLPQTSILGLASYFQSVENLSPLFTQKEFKRYKEGKGITIGKLSTYLETINQELMLFLSNYLDLLTFRSYSSTPLRLPLQPTKELENLLIHLIPTAKGAKLYQPTLKLFKLRERLFGLSTTPISISNQLLRSFLITFGIYEELGKKLLDKELFLSTWYKDLNE